jgi:hypothetical protein
MRFYDQQHPFYAGIDLHSRTMHLCILDATGSVVFDKNLPVLREVGGIHEIMPSPKQCKARSRKF